MPRRGCFGRKPFGEKRLAASLRAAPLGVLPPYRAGEHTPHFRARPVGWNVACSADRRTSYPDWGGPQPQVLDSTTLSRQAGEWFGACYPAEIAAIKDYDGAGR